MLWFINWSTKHAGTHTQPEHKALQFCKTICANKTCTHRFSTDVFIDHRIEELNS